MWTGREECNAFTDGHLELSDLPALPSYVLMKLVKSRVKYLFGFSIIAVLAILIVTNIWFVREFIPGAWEHFNDIRSRGDEENMAIMAFFLFTPMVWVGGWLYYRLFKYLDRKYSGNTRHQAAADASRTGNP